MKIYLDIDDTLGDFKRQAVYFGVPSWEGTWYTSHPETWSDEQKEIDRLTKLAMEKEEFWLTMPHNEGAFELLTASLARCETNLLTALPPHMPEEFYPMIRSAKVQWAWQVLHVPPERVAVVQRKDKIKYARYWNGQNILVDDAEQNVREWIAADGVGHHFVDMGEAINFIKTL